MDSKSCCVVNRLLIRLCLAIAIFASMLAHGAEVRAVDISAWIKQLDAKSDDERTTAADALVKAKEAVRTESFEVLLADMGTAPRTKKLALYVLGRIGDRQSTNLILRATYDPEPSVAVAAWEALEDAYPKQADVIVSNLIDAQNYSIREAESVKFLKKIGRRAFVDLEQKIFHERTIDHQAIAILKSMTWAGEAAPRASSCGSSSGNPDDDPSMLVIHKSGRALRSDSAEIQELIPNVDEYAIYSLMNFLDDPNSAVREQAAQYLRRYEKYPAALMALKFVAKDEDWAVRIEGQEALKKISDDDGSTPGTSK